MNDPELTDRIIEQGQVLVRAIDALDTIDKSGWFEQGLVWILLKVYRHRTGDD